LLTADVRFALHRGVGDEDVDQQVWRLLIDTGGLLRRHGFRLGLALVALVAFVVRLTPLLVGGGLGGYGRYDDGVYFAAAASLDSGRVPYRDFVLLHPPGIMLVLAPFAWLARLTSDGLAMTVARLTFMAIGAANAVLVSVLVARWRRWAGIIAGLVYACWLPAVYGEQTTLLEPLGTTALLVALLVLVKTERAVSMRTTTLAGVVLGLAVALKIWYVAPWAVVVAWQLALRNRAAAIRIAVSGAAALGLVVLPFALLARGAMVNMVLRDQLLRPQAESSRVARVASILGVQGVVTGHHREVVVVTAIGVVMLLAAVTICVTDRAARVLVALLTVNLSVLLASPSYFGHYAELTAAPAAAVVGVALSLLTTRKSRLALPFPSAYGTAGAVVVAVLISGVNVATKGQGKVVAGDALADVAPTGCIASDDPDILIQMDRLSGDLRHGCQLPVDVTGITYDALCRRGPNGKSLARRDNVAWQRYLDSYLTSADAFVVARSAGDGLSHRTAKMLQAQVQLVSAHGLMLRVGSGTHASATVEGVLAQKALPPCR
jgi:alpha-1,2-mannosyltransferase